MKYKAFFYSLLLSLFIIACKNEKSNTIADKTADLQKSPSVATQAETAKDVIDTANYNGLPHWDSTMIHTGPDGYLDTFTVDNQPFRVVHHDTAFDGMVEVYQKGKWYKNIEFTVVGNNNDYDRTVDFNGDGYIDMLESFKRYGKYYLYNPSQKRFSDTASDEIGDVWGIIDSSQHILYTAFEANLTSGQVYSFLFTYKNNQKVTPFSAKIYYKKNDEDQLVQRIVIYKNDTQKIKEIKPEAKISIMDFNYVQFWKEQYSKLNQ